MEPLCSPFGGFIVSIPSAGIPQGFYVPPNKSYRIAPPTGWAIVPSSEGGVEFLSPLADQGYWPGMFIAKEPAEESQPQEARINNLVAKDRDAFRFISREVLELPAGRAYMVIYEHTFERRQMRTAEAHFVCDGVRYWVPFNALATTFNRHFPTYLNCLKTFAPVATRIWN